MTAYHGGRAYRGEIESKKGCSGHALVPPVQFHTTVFGGVVDLFVQLSVFLTYEYISSSSSMVDFRFQIGVAKTLICVSVLLFLRVRI